MGGDYIKKIFLCLPMIILIFMLQANVVYADAGPKPSIVINAINMPDKLCYMDLLVEGQTSKVTKNQFGDSKYNQRLMSILREYHEDGMSSLLVNDLMHTYGDIICQTSKGKCTMNYNYRVPDKFKIIVVSDDGNIVISNLINRKSYDSIIHFDYQSAKANEGTFYLPFLLTYILTLLTEGIILYLFKFNIRENIKVFLIVNTLTQIFLYFMISLGMNGLGTFGGFALSIISEIIILIVEAFLFAKILKGHSKRRRILYSITSNVASFIVGVFFALFSIIYLV